MGKGKRCAVTVWICLQDVNSSEETKLKFAESNFFVKLNNPNKFDLILMYYGKRTAIETVSINSCYLSSWLLFMTKYSWHDKILVS